MIKYNKKNQLIKYLNYLKNYIYYYYALQIVEYT